MNKAVKNEHKMKYSTPRAYILLRRRGHATPIVTVQTSKFFSVTKNSNIAQVRTCSLVKGRQRERMAWDRGYARARANERVLKIVTLKNFDGCTSCMPSSPKESLFTPSSPLCGILANVLSMLHV